MVDCHIHMVLDGVDWRSAIARHANEPDCAQIRRVLEQYRRRGVTYLRDGGDRWGVGKTARAMAAEFGIIYRTPLYPISRWGHYGGFIGRQYETLQEYRILVAEVRRQGGDFIKLMISGLMDFDHAGVLTQPGLEPGEIRELIHIAHEEGFSVMAHANGARTVEAACQAGVDSIEHGAYLDQPALAALASSGTVWVPTLSTIGDLLGKKRYDQAAVETILAGAMENVRLCAALGGSIAPGSDAGAWAVPHGVGCDTEYALLAQALGADWKTVVQAGVQVIQEKF